MFAVFAMIVRHVSAGMSLKVPSEQHLSAVKVPDQSQPEQSLLLAMRDTRATLHQLLNQVKAAKSKVTQAEQALGSWQTGHQAASDRVVHVSKIVDCFASFPELKQKLKDFNSKLMEINVNLDLSALVMEKVFIDLFDAL